MLVAAVALVLWVAVPVRAQVLKGSLIFYTTRSSFDAAEPGLPVEGFNNANIASGSLALQSSPLGSATNDSVFSSGSILPGLTISNLSPSLASNGLIVYGGGAISGGSTSVGTNWFGDTLVLTFAPGVSAVGTDVFAATSPGQTLAGDFTEDVYNGSTQLGSMTFSEAKGAFGFIGVSSTTPITSVNLLYTTDDATTFVDNIAFGSPTASVPGSPTPTITSTATPTVTATHSATAIPTPTATPTPTLTNTSGTCVGDCDGSSDVTVNEIIRLVNIALGNAPVTTCEAGDANHDHEITIDEILTAVHNALNGCPRVPTKATQTATTISTEMPTPTQAAMAPTTYPAPTGSVSPSLFVVLNLIGGGKATLNPVVGPNCYLGMTCGFPAGYVGTSMSYTLPDGSTATLPNFNGSFFPAGAGYEISGQASGTDSLGRAVTVNNVTVTMRISCRSGRGGGCSKVYTGGSLTLTLNGPNFQNTGGHLCYRGMLVGSIPYDTARCEHFGVGTITNPSNSLYRWMKEDPTAPGSLIAQGSPVTIPAPVWTVNPTGRSQSTRSSPQCTTRSMAAQVRSQSARG